MNCPLQIQSGNVYYKDDFGLCSLQEFCEPLRPKFRFKENNEWANCGIAKHHGSLVTEQNFAKHGDRIFSSTGSFINSNLWKIQIIVQLNLNFQEICTSCSIFVRSFGFIQATDS